MLIVGGVSTTDFPFGPRLSALVPVLALLPALFLGNLWSSAERALGVGRARLPALIFCFIFLALAGQQNYPIYNVDFAMYPQDSTSVLARYLTTLPPGEPVYL